MGDSKRAYVFASLAVLVAGGLAADSIKPVEVARSDTYTEGPVFDYEGSLFFSHNEGVTKLTPEGVSSLWFAGKPNGHKVLPDGNHLVCVPGAVLRLDPRGKVLGKASSECDGRPLRSPNDLTLDQHGGVYFSDPGGSREAPIGSVHYVDRAGVTHLVAGGMRVPNGLVLSPEGSDLYVAETVPNRILVFSVKAPGMLGPLKVFAELPSKPGVTAEPDGLAVDTEGNLYVAHLGMTTVQVLNPRGKLIRSLPAGNFDASNLVFGGLELDQLYVTGSIGHRTNTPGRVYRLDLPTVRGVSSLLRRN